MSCFALDFACVLEPTFWNFFFTTWILRRQTFGLWSPLLQKYFAEVCVLENKNWSFYDQINFSLYAEEFLTPNILARVTSPGLILVRYRALLSEQARAAQKPAWWDYGDQAEITCCQFWSSWHGVLEGPHGARFTRWCSSINAFASIEIVNSSCRVIGLSTDYMNLLIIITSISTALNSYFVQDK